MNIVGLHNASEDLYKSCWGIDEDLPKIDGVYRTDQHIKFLLRTFFGF